MHHAGIRLVLHRDGFATIGGYRSVSNAGCRCIRWRESWGGIIPRVVRESRELSTSLHPIRAATTGMMRYSSRSFFRMLIESRRRRAAAGVRGRVRVWPYPFPKRYAQPGAITCIDIGASICDRSSSRCRASPSHKCASSRVHQRRFCARSLDDLIKKAIQRLSVRMGDA